MFCSYLKLAFILLKSFKRALISLSNKVILNNKQNFNLSNSSWEKNPVLRTHLYLWFWLFGRLFFFFSENENNNPVGKKKML